MKKIDDKCIICLNKANCKSICKHPYCKKCFAKFAIIHDNKECAYCRQNLNDTIILLKKNTTETKKDTKIKK